MKKGGFGKNKPVLITIVALVVLAAMILASAGRGTANWFENAVGAVLTPVQGFAARASNSIADFFRGVFNTTDADKENAKLKSELALYNKMQLELEELKKENERLRGLLEYSGSFGECSGVAASVTGRSTDIYFRVFTVNAGRNQGIDVDMPVICADGLVGRVTEVGATWSKVTAVIDAETSLRRQYQFTITIYILILDIARTVIVHKGLLRSSQIQQPNGIYTTRYSY